jgi:succinoglycan biosynthesis protein ExoM
MTVSICIATYRRPDSLRALLTDIAEQEWAPYEVIVVDNDAQRSAQPVIAERKQFGLPCPLHYDVQPRQNISLTRNRTVELATGHWLAFLDDDERVPRSWLRQMMTALATYSADGVLGPVVPVVPERAPAWIRRGHFYDWPRMRSGSVVPRNRLRFGNVILRGGSVRRYAAPFDPAYGLTGGEDGDLLSRLANDGARIVWCDEAIVHEPIVDSRLSFNWLLRRALRGGQDFGRHTLAGRYGAMNGWKCARFMARAALQGITAAGLALLSLPLGRHTAAHWLLKSAANAGKISVFYGWHYREYAATPLTGSDTV